MRNARSRSLLSPSPFDRREPWTQNLVSYWNRLGGTIGEEVQVDRQPNGQDVRVRAVRVRPAVVRSLVPRDVNIVAERLEPLSPTEQFDLIVATNIFVYYDRFEQSLAAANLASMLRSGGVLGARPSNRCGDHIVSRCAPTMSAGDAQADLDQA